jgi:ankyrin repeat protein
MEQMPPLQLSDKEKLSLQMTKQSKTSSQDGNMWILFTKQMLQKTIDLNKKKYHELKISLAKSQEAAISIAKTSSVETMSVEVMTTTLVQTLARIISRTVINDGKRKVLLRRELRLQERMLKEKYKDTEFLRLERERLRREQAEYIVQLRLRLTTTLSKSLAYSTAQQSIQIGKQQAFNKLYDPWWMLDVPIDRLVPPFVQRTVESLYHSCKRRTYINILAFVFRGLRVDYAAKNLQEQLSKRFKFQSWTNWVRYRELLKNTQQSVLTVQCLVRTFLWKRRCYHYLRRQSQTLALAVTKDSQLRHDFRLRLYVLHWLKIKNLRQTFRKCRAALQERRFLICFYSWLHQYKQIFYQNMMMTAKRLRQCTLVQSIIRQFLAKCRVMHIRSNLVLSRFVLAYRARRRMLFMLQYRRRIECDGVSFVKSNQIRFQQLIGWKIWHKFFSIRKGISKMDQIHRRHHFSLSWQQWLLFALARKDWLSLRAVKIQSVTRMYLTHLHVLKFSRFRKSIVKFQSLWRKTKARRLFVYQMYYFRFARAIQRVMRGWKVRNQLVYRRVLDIHHAALHNNFDRLKYYIDKFPNLLLRKDKDGNTALHSAAYGGARRTLKLLIRERIFKTEDDLNAFNDAGYSPLHLLITSTAIHRDELFGYMIEHGFDEDLLTLHDGKTCLLLAVEYGRVGIMNRLLTDGHDANIADNQGRTCLQAACQQGDAIMVRALLDNDANASQVGAQGSYPVHDCVLGGNVEVLNLLLQHNIDVNALDGTYFQTPVMWACQGGDKAEIVAQLVAYNADVYITEASTGRTAAHLAAISNSRRVYEALRVADVEFDYTDNEGNTPLHLAAYYGAEDFARNLLQGGCFPSYQNNVGDTPAHVAARYNQLSLIKLICEYDTQIGKLNYSHQSPLAVAKFYQSMDVVEFLDKHYRMIEIVDGRNDVGEIWWDKEIDLKVADWEMRLTPDGERYFVNKWTGATSTTPPMLSLEAVQSAASNAAVPLRRNVVMVREQDLASDEINEGGDIPVETTGIPSKEALTKHQYYREFHEQKKEIALMSVDFRAATIINKFARRKLAYLEAKRTAKQNRRVVALTRFVRSHLKGFMRYRYEMKQRTIVKIQARWKGYIFRKRFYAVPDGDYFKARDYLARRRLRYQLWSIWTLYKRRRRFQRLLLIKKTSKSLTDWADTIEKARFPTRVVGVYEEYLYPGTTDIYFFRHSINGACSFTKPKKLIMHDEQQEVFRSQLKTMGATIPQINLTIKLQAIWRGFQVRNYYHFLEKAMEISQSAEKKYLENPEKDANLYNYSLHCFTVLQAIDRARNVYIESLSRMQWRGPDIAFVLYSYCVFGLTSGDEEYVDILPLIARAKKAEFVRMLEIRQKIDSEITSKTIAMNAISQGNAVTLTSQQLLATLNNNNSGSNTISVQTSALPKEDEYRYGKVFDLANTGFFKYAANTINNGLAWMSFAICRFIVYDDFPASFDAFMVAFTCDPDNPTIKKTFQFMMTHFHGPDKKIQDDVIKKRMRYHAQKAADIEEQRRILREAARRKQWAAAVIQVSVFFCHDKI